MSLTRDEWAKMWEAIKTIELNATPREKIVSSAIEYIKQQIQSVVGQME